MTRLVTALLAWAFLASGCSVPGAQPYRLVALFSKAPSLYEEARVKVMGLDAGYVDDIGIEGDRVRVSLRVDRHVPLPAGVKAVVAPQNTLGERNVVLYPPWKPGDRRVQPGATIPLERTELPVEIDDALDAFTELTDALDDEKLGDVAGDLADGVRGRGKTIGDAVSDTSRLTGVLAEQDRQLVALAKGLSRLATGLNERERQVTGAIDSFAEASSILAEERRRLRGFVSSMAGFVRRGDVIIEQYAQRLPQAASTLAELVLTVRANSASAAQAVKGAADFADVIIDSWDRDQHVLKIRVVLNALTRAWLAPLFDSLGLGDVPCLPAGLSNCPFQRRPR
ncbi:MCE family protein [Nonomuraea sp. KC401]|uniref:MCE family protein n=1 Tax=unclassified Nonomuraea TaxID=2593643 RepID=UPI0010FD643A|nr:MULTISPECIES: MCE family protein [unclassified Nonomuraea]NBE93592.1 MCE family protein [Nonomuraea sp. K271]TLF80004.1 MCE family protein [Nonomuraea sp. KC401]